MIQKAPIIFLFTLLATANADFKLLQQNFPELWAKYVETMHIQDPNATPAPTTANPACSAHLRTGKLKTVVKLYDSTSSDPINQLQPNLWQKFQREFIDYYSCDFVEIDTSKCPNVTPDITVKTPAYLMMNGQSILSACNSPDTFEKLWNYFLSYAWRGYKKQKNFTGPTNDVCDISYPIIKGEMLNFQDHDDRVYSNQCVVLYYDSKCTYSRMFIALWNTIFDEFHEDLTFYAIDCLTNRRWCADRGAWGYPTVLLRNSGNIIEYKGNANAEEMKNFIRTNKV